MVHAGEIDRILQLFVLLGRFLKLLLQARQLLFVLRLQLTKLVSEVGAEVVSLLFGLGQSRFLLLIRVLVFSLPLFLHLHHNSLLL